MANYSDKEACQVQRQSYWSEIDIEEKVARTRKVVKELQSQVYRLSKKMNKLEQHKHDIEGVAVIIERLSYCGEMSITPEKDTDETYF